MCNISESDTYHIKKYLQALKEHKPLKMQYLKFLFIGGPVTGKTTTRDRLVGEYVNLKSCPPDRRQHNSTGVIDTSEVIKWDICTASDGSQSERKIFSPVNYSNQSSTAGSSNKAMDIKSVIQLLIQMIATKSEDTRSSVRTQSTTQTIKNKFPTESIALTELELILTNSGLAVTDTRTESVVDSGLTITDTKLSAHEVIPVVNSPRKIATQESTVDASDQFKDINDAFEQLKAITSESAERIIQEMVSVLIRINDTGGQMFFQDMLPALTTGHALYLVFFRQDKPLNKPVHVEFRKKGKKIALPISYIPLEVILQGLSSIKCFGTCTDPVTEETYQSRALLIGTFKGELSEGTSEDDVNNVLVKELKKAHLYTQVCQTTDGKKFFSLDNEKGGVDEINTLHDLLITIISDKEYYPMYDVPAPWFIFRMVLHLLRKSVVTYDECEEIAKRLNMGDTLETALWYFTEKVGSLMRFEKSAVPSLKNQIICSTQIVFDSITELIVEKISHPNAECDKWDKGRFYSSKLKVVNDSTSKKILQRAILKVEQLIEILKHLGIIAPIGTTGEDSASKHVDTEYIIPAILESASEEELNPMEPSEHISCPLFIEFKCGYVPLGIFCAEIASLINSKKEWNLMPEAYRNKFTFCIKQAFHVTLIATPRYLQIQLKNFGDDTSLSNECINVRKNLECTLLEVYRRLNSKFNIKEKHPFSLAFYCHHEHGTNNTFKSDHRMRIESPYCMPTQGLCADSDTQQSMAKSPGAKSWFEYVSKNVMYVVAELLYLMWDWFRC